MRDQQGQDMRQCIDDCLDCHRICLQEAMNHCLETGGEHVAPKHFRLMMNCAQICQTAADFMLSASRYHMRVCAACAEVCEACSKSCAQVGDMDVCVETCRRCAESCRAMAGGAVHGLTGSVRRDSDAPVKAPM